MDMNLSKKLLYMAMCIICTLPLQISVKGQNRPNWATPTYNKPLAKSYLEVVVEGGNDKDDIIYKAQAEIKRRRKLKVGEENAWVKSGYVASYWEQTDNGLTGYFLYQTPNNPSYQSSDIEKVTSTSQYPFSARVFVPGWMQFYKGQKIKASTIIAGELLCIGGFAFAKTRKNYYAALIGSTNNPTLKQRYATNANTYNIVSYGFLAGALGVYAWNIIDGLVARGTPYVSVDGKMISFVPYATPESVGLALTMSF
jgi:hypothetical protein